MLSKSEANAQVSDVQTSFAPVDSHSHPNNLELDGLIIPTIKTLKKKKHLNGLFWWIVW